MGLINKNSPAFKPQNQFNESVRTRAIAKIQDWLKEFELSGYNARLLATELIDRAIKDKIQRTAPTAAEVWHNDPAKIESLAMSAMRIANTLDEAEELDKLLDRLTDQDAQNEGNSI